MLDFINQSGPVKFFVAFAIVLALIGLTAWLVRRFGANRLGSSTRGRQPRLAVIDAASVDGRRRLILIRRDNVEHLMMIGGPNDLLVEPNIVRATATRDSGRDGYRPASQDARQETRQDARAERSTPVVETNGGSWPLQPTVEPPLPVPAQPPQPRATRDYRAPVTDEPWVPPEVPSREPALRSRPQDHNTGSTGSISGMAAEFNAKLNPEFDIPPAPPRMAIPVREAAPVVPPPVAQPLPPNTDRNLAEMAQRLEAALRRPNTKDDIRPPATDPLAAPLKSAEPKLDFAPEVKAEPKFEPKVEAKIEAKAEAKNPFDSLEEEMASLLGRQPGKT